MPTQDQIIERRKQVMPLLAAGYITQSEAAKIIGVTRQCISQWVREEKLKPLIARSRHIKDLLKHAAAHM